MAGLPEDHPQVCVTRYNLGRAYATRNGEGDATSGAHHLLAAAALDWGPPKVRAMAARTAGGLLAGIDWEQATDAFASAIGILDTIADHRLNRTSKLRNLAQFGGLAADAAASALACDDPARAIGLLDQGRGVLIAQRWQTRTDPTALAERDARLARLIGSLSRELAADEGDRPVRSRQVAERWRDALAQARALPGMTDFLAAPDADRLRSGLPGVAVALVDSTHGCSAIAVSPDLVRAIALPGVTAADLRAHAEEVTANTRTQTWDTNDVIEAALDWLWRDVVRPVITDLAAAGVLDKRLWWVPTGAFALLPVHAAGLHRSAGVEDRLLRSEWVFSYTPTIRALNHLRERYPGTLDRRAPLVIGIRKTATSADELEFARAEAEAVHARLGGARPPLLDDRATTKAVGAALSQATWVHIATHAVTSANPDNSRLLLADGDLSVGEIIRSDGTGGSFAYLSACGTAADDGQVLDEALHICSAFQVAGFAHVIGTLWPVADDIAKDTALALYTELDDAEPAQALHEVLCAASAEYPDNPFLWASYLHYGL